MAAYALKRLLMMVPTLLGITLACFILIQLVPGGPVEDYLNRVRGMAAESGAVADRGISEAELAIVKAHFGFDQPAHVRYFTWLWNCIRLDFGTSYFYEEPVWDVLIERVPISLFFGLTSLLLSYAICIPLGISKAIKVHSRWDAATSTAIYIGYVIPSYALGVLLIVFFCGGSYLDWFPMGGIHSEGAEDLGPIAYTLDFLPHMCLPMVCYMAGEFAVLTTLMKNSLLEEIKKDYIRTAQLKGSTRLRAILIHGCRNSLIPLATRASEVFTIIFAGALLLEKVFDIDGMGLLFYKSITHHDYNVVLALIVLTSVLSLLGRLFSDLLYAWIDPRIRFK